MSRGPILVLGASGSLGRTLVKASADAGRRAIGLCRQECDITDPTAIAQALARHRPGIVVNAAAFADVDAAESNRTEAAAVNAEGPAILGAKAADAGVPVVHISTDYVFDGKLRRPYSEDDPLAPLGTYGATKASGEAGLRAAQPHHVILRSSWLFGEHGGGFVEIAIEAALGLDPVRAIVDQTGSPTAMVDLAGAVFAVDDAIDPEFQAWGTYHYAGCEPARRVDMVTTIFDAVRALGRDVPEIVPVSLADFAGAAPRPDYSVLDSRRFVRTFGFPASDWKKHLTALVDSKAETMEQPTV